MAQVRRRRSEVDQLVDLDRVMLGYAEQLGAVREARVYRERIAALEAGRPVRCSGWEVGVRPLYEDVILAADGTLTPA